MLLSHLEIYQSKTRRKHTKGYHHCCSMFFCFVFFQKGCYKCNPILLKFNAIPGSPPAIKHRGLANPRTSSEPCWLRTGCRAHGYQIPSSCWLVSSQLSNQPSFMTYVTISPHQFWCVHFIILLSQKRTTIIDILTYSHRIEWFNMV